MASTNSREPFPAPRAGDYADSAARALISAIPGLGGPATQLIATVITPPLEQRRADWLNDLADRLERLEQPVEGFTVQSLADNEEFVTAVTTASQIALRNHNPEKLAALRNAVANVALRTEPDGELQSVFLSVLDYLTPLHMRVLFFFNAPRAFVESSGRETAGAVTTRDIALRVLPDIPPDAYDWLCRDLENRGLIHLPADFTVGLTDERSTELGRRFLRFISEQ